MNVFSILRSLHGEQLLHFASSIQISPNTAFDFNQQNKYFGVELLEVDIDFFIDSREQKILKINYVNFFRRISFWL